MAESIHSLGESHLARIEPEDRLLVLARTIQAQDPETDTALNHAPPAGRGAIEKTKFAEALAPTG